MLNFNAFQFLDLIDRPFKKLWKAHHLITPTGLCMDEVMLQPLNFERCLSQKLFVAHACVSYMQIALVHTFFKISNLLLLTVLLAV